MNDSTRDQGLRGNDVSDGEMRGSALGFVETHFHVVEVGRRGVGDDQLGNRRFDTQPRFHQLARADVCCGAGRLTLDTRR